MGTKSTKPITQPQLRKIYAKAREAGLDNDYLHELRKSPFWLLTRPKGKSLISLGGAARSTSRLLTTGISMAFSIG